MGAQRIGIGYDIHRLRKGRKLVLGGVVIPHPSGLLGHSDADVVLHSVADAVLGAAGLDDIGVHFPDTNPHYRGISSGIILGKACGMCKRKGYRVVNIDCTVIAEEPKIGKYRALMKERISGIAGTRHVNVKATTNEGLGFIGRKEGIASFAVALIEKIK
jgi:2-C-methyl-D-erythritol 2,4-cyclodiphosphate synthase